MRYEPISAWIGSLNSSPITAFAQALDNDAVFLLLVLLIIAENVVLAGLVQPVFLAISTGIVLLSAFAPPVLMALFDRRKRQPLPARKRL